MSFSNRTRAEIYSQLAAMEKAGLPADKAWSMLNSKDPNAVTGIQSVRKAIARGGNIALAARRSNMFTPFETNLVSASLEAGSPGHVYSRLAFSCTQRAKNEGKMKSKMVFPIAILILALCVQPLPKLFIGAVGFFGYLGHVLGPLLVLYALYLLFKSVKASPTLSQLFLKAPIYGRAIARENAISFYESLALLLEAGVAMFEALPVALATISNPDIRTQYERLKPSMVHGLSLSEAITKEVSNRLYLGSPQVTEFISTGEASGTLPEMLLRHVDIETESLTLFWSMNADWIPKIAYAFVAGWMVFNLVAV